MNGEYRTAVILFGVALAVAIVIASLTTLERGNIRIASNGAPWHDGASEAAPSA